MNFVRISDADFNLDTISWVTPRLAVTDMYGAQSVVRKVDCYVINTAREINSPCYYKLAVTPFLVSREAVRAVLDTLADVIHKQIETTENKVFVHCFAGMGRSVLTCVWYLCKHHRMSMDEAYKAVRKVRPVALDRREWAVG